MNKLVSYYIYNTEKHGANIRYIYILYTKVLDWRMERNIFASIPRGRRAQTVPRNVIKKLNSRIHQINPARF